MIRQLPIFKDEDNNLCMLKGAVCDACHIEMTESFIVLTDIHRKGVDTNLLCPRCSKKHFREATYLQETKFGYIKEQLDKKDVPVVLIIPSIRDNKDNYTVWSARELVSDKVVDHAWRSILFPSIEGASVGKSVELLEEEEEKRLIEFEKKSLTTNKEVV